MKHCKLPSHKEQWPPEYGETFLHKGNNAILALKAKTTKVFSKMMSFNSIQVDKVEEKDTSVDGLETVGKLLL